jgi:thioesterase domain-containing protein
MLAARLLGRVHEEFGVTIALTDFLEHGTTIAGLAVLVGGDRRADRDQPANGRKLFMVYPDLASAMSVRHLTTRLDTHPLLPMSYIGTEIPTTVEEFAGHVLGELRTTQPHGPYALAGFSFGGMVAYELARLLLDAGERVDWLGIVDTPTPQLANGFIRRRRSPLARLAQLRQPGRRKRIGRYLSTLRWSLTERAMANGLLERGHVEQIDLRHIWSIIRRYTRDGHDVPLAVFITSDTAAQVDATALGWDDLHRGPLALHYLTGDHDSVLEAHQAVELAELIRACLEP